MKVHQIIIYYKKCEACNTSEVLVFVTSPNMEDNPSPIAKVPKEENIPGQPT